MASIVFIKEENRSQQIQVNPCCLTIQGRRLKLNAEEYYYYPGRLEHTEHTLNTHWNTDATHAPVSLRP